MSSLRAKTRADDSDFDSASSGDDGQLSDDDDIPLTKCTKRNQPSTSQVLVNIVMVFGL